MLNNLIGHGPLTDLPVPAADSTGKILPFPDAALPDAPKHGPGTTRFQDIIDLLPSGTGDAPVSSSPSDEDLPELTLGDLDIDVLADASADQTEGDVAGDALTDPDSPVLIQLKM